MSTPTIDGMILRCRTQGERLRTLTRSAALRRWALVAAALIFAGGLYYSIDRIEFSIADIHWQPLLWLVIAGIPATVILNTMMTELAASVVGFRFGWRRALVITVFGSAANMLPLPGAAMVRIAGLKAVGASLRRSTAVTFAMAMLWLGIAFAYSGAFLLVLRPWLGLAALTLGLGALTAGTLWARYLNGGWQTAAHIILITLALIVVSVIRVQLSLSALGVNASFTQVSIFAISGVIGSAVSIVPAGLGIREAVSAGLAPIVNIPASVAFVATAIDRIVAMTVLLLLTLALSTANLKPQHFTKEKSRG